MSCGRAFQSKRRKLKCYQRLWSDYIWKKQSIRQLARQEDRSIQWVRDVLEQSKMRSAIITPQQTVVIADTTFWGRSYGVCVFRSPELKKNIWFDEVESERVATYYYGRKILEERGWTLTGAVVDGRRGLARVFSDIPVQICQFHQMKRVTKYVTRRPETLAGQELRSLTLQLTKSNEVDFAHALNTWHARWKDCINEKTRITGCRRWFYTHKNVRSAYVSLITNLPHLFTYQKYPELNMPNTTNSLDGMFSQLKARLAVHRGLRRGRRYKVITEILNGEEN